MASIHKFKIPFLLSALVFSFLPRVSAADFAPCTEKFSCYFSTPSRNSGGYSADAPGNQNLGVQLGTPSFPIVLWNRSLQFYFLAEKSIPETLTKAIVDKFEIAFKDLKIYDPFPSLPQLVFASAESSAQLYNDNENNKYWDLGSSRYFKHHISFFKNIIQYEKRYELDFLKPIIQREKSIGGNVFITISEFDQDGADKGFPWNEAESYAGFPKNVIASFTRDKYSLESHIDHYRLERSSVFVKCETKLFVNAVDREIFGMIMHIHVRSKEWRTNSQTISPIQGCVPLIFAIPLPYRYVSQAFENMIKENSYYFDFSAKSMLRMKDLLSTPP